MTALLLAEDSRRADALAQRSGISSWILMQNAGRRAAQIIRRHYAPCHVHILCGPGNNGGDGFIAAQHLLHHGFDARVFLSGDRQALQGDAQRAASLWRGKIHPLDNDYRPDHHPDHHPAALVIDALFGTGLARPLEGIAARLAEEISAPVIALDMPSGINSDDGQKIGAAFAADHTIAFAAPHPGHFLLPGRLHCGQVHIADIGIPADVIDEIAPRHHLNAPELFLDALAPPAPSAHKYQRGWAVICAGGAEKGGAGRLAAMAALRIGAGLVTINCPPDAQQIHAAHLTSIMLEDCDLAASLADQRRTAILIGPGYGFADDAVPQILSALNTDIDVVLDADALTMFETHPETLWRAIKNRPQGATVLTPHEGEYKRLFPDLVQQTKIDRARHAAQRAGAIILLKGADSVIATPQGDVVINANAPAWLATAGTGDVLAGMITGLLAQKPASALDAVSAACFMHGVCGAIAGRGLIAEDLPAIIPIALHEILNGD